MAMPWRRTDALESRLACWEQAHLFGALRRDNCAGKDDTIVIIESAESAT